MHQVSDDKAQRHHQDKRDMQVIQAWGRYGCKDTRLPVRFISSCETNDSERQRADIAEDALKIQVEISTQSCIRISDECRFRAKHPAERWR
jgi:hypothetical protein